MKTDNYRINSILIIVAVAFVILGIFINDPFGIFRYSYNVAKPLIQKIKQKDIFKATVIENSKELYVISKKGDVWQVVDLQVGNISNTSQNMSESKMLYRVNKKDFLAGLNNLFEARKTREITSNEKKHSEYQVSPYNSLQVLLYGKDNKKQFHVHLGKAGSNFSSTLVRLDSDKKVYSVPLKLRTYWSKTVDQIRDKSLFKIFSENIDAIEWDFIGLKDKNNFALKRKKENEKEWQVIIKDKQNEGNLEKINVFLRDIQDLKGSNFYKEDIESLKKAAVLNIILQNKLNIPLEIYKKEKDNEVSYFAKSNYLLSFVGLPNYKIDKLLEDSSYYIKKQTEDSNNKKDK